MTFLSSFAPFSPRIILRPRSSFSSFMCIVWLISLTQCSPVQTTFLQMTSFCSSVWTNKIPLCTKLPLLYPLLHWWAPQLVPHLGYYEQCSRKHRCARLWDTDLDSFGLHSGSLSVILSNFQTDFTVAAPVSAPSSMVPECPFPHPCQHLVILTGMRGGGISTQF